jgi:protein involved in polysaccharide export with SLBB domain
MFRRLMLVAAVAAQLVAVAGQPAAAAAAAVSQAQTQSPAQAGRSAPGPLSTQPATRAGLQYKLGIGDKIRVIVYGEEALSGEFFVNDSGKVSLPLIGEVRAAELSVQDFQSEIETALRQGYLREPRVSAEVLTYRPFYILGEINKPGEYPFANGLNVLNAVATAGGFTYRAQTKRVYIRRAGETREESYSVTSELAVSPGDTIRVGERFF